MARDYGIAIGAAIVVALVIRFFVLEAYRIPSASMRPALEAGDTIFVDKWSFGLRMPGSDETFTRGRAPVRGEVVVYSPVADPERDYLKRVVGVAGDSVEIRAGQLMLNGSAVALGGAGSSVCGEEQLPGGARYEVCREPPLPANHGPVKIPDGQVFLLGDLRTQGPDSRKGAYFDLVPLTALKARALWVWLSVDPPALGDKASWFSRIRFERMFKRIR